MANIANAVRWARDIAQVLVVDRFDSRRRHYAEIASTACRSLSFHSRCKVKPEPLTSILQKLGGSDVAQVVLPGPAVALGDVGSQTGYFVLGALVSALRPKTILEFGTYLGVSALAMALNTDGDSRIYTVDLPDEVPESSIPDLNAIDLTHVAKSRRRVGEAFLGRPEEQKITQIRADSITFRAEKVVSNADFVYVDGGHTTALVTADTDNAFRVLSSTGTIVWDDYFHLYPDVVKFIDERSEEYDIVGIADTNYVIFSRRWKGSHE